MRPIAIFRFSPTEGPGYFAAFLDRHGIERAVEALEPSRRIPPARIVSRARMEVYLCQRS